MNTAGLVAALSAFLAIWLGHVSVRKIEWAAPSLWLPAALFTGLGIALEWLSLNATSLAVSTAAGIVGVSLLWDALELVRQQARVRKGHAPANPANPRHARMLAEPLSQAITIRLLKREPVGRPQPHSAEGL